MNFGGISILSGQRKQRSYMDRQNCRRLSEAKYQDCKNLEQKRKKKPPPKEQAVCNITRSINRIFFTYCAAI